MQKLDIIVDRSIECLNEFSWDIYEFDKFNYENLLYVNVKKRENSFCGLLFAINLIECFCHNCSNTINLCFACTFWGFQKAKSSFSHSTFGWPHYIPTQIAFFTIFFLISVSDNFDTENMYKFRFNRKTNGKLLTET